MAIGCTRFEWKWTFELEEIICDNFAMFCIFDLPLIYLDVFDTPVWLHRIKLIEFLFGVLRRKKKNAPRKLHHNEKKNDGVKRCREKKRKSMKRPSKSVSSNQHIKKANFSPINAKRICSVCCCCCNKFNSAFMNDEFYGKIYTVTVYIYQYLYKRMYAYAFFSFFSQIQNGALVFFSVWNKAQALSV